MRGYTPVREGVHADVFSQARPPSRPRAGSVSGAHAGSGPGALPVPSERGRHERDASAGQGQGHRGNKWWTLVAVCLGTFMLLLDITIVNVALPDIQDALHASFPGCSGWWTPTR